MINNKMSIITLIKKKALEASSIKNDNTIYNKKLSQAKFLISNIKNEEIKKKFQEELDNITNNDNKKNINKKNINKKKIKGGNSKIVKFFKNNNIISNKTKNLLNNSKDIITNNGKNLLNNTKNLLNNSKDIINNNGKNLLNNTKNLITDSAKNILNSSNKFNEKITNYPKNILNSNKNISNSGSSPSYPNNLQIIPLDPHTTKKTSASFDAYLSNLENKINDITLSTTQQSEYIKNIQNKMNDERNIIYKNSGKVDAASIKTSYKVVQTGIKSLELLIKALWNIIQKIGIVIYRIAVAFIEFCKTQPVALICWIIAMIIFFILLIFFFFGAEITYEDNNNLDENSKIRNQNSNNYRKYNINNNKSDKFNLLKFINNPKEYTNNFANNFANNLEYPILFSKLIYNTKKLSDTLLKGTGISLNEKYKFERPQNKADDNKTLLQRVNNLSEIENNLLNDNIKKNVYGEINDENNKTKAISLIKPKNIEWKFPYIDYSKNTDINDIPEVIKKYKKDSNDYSINDTTTLIFPWEKEGNKYVLNCNAKFKNLDPKISSNLYKNQGNYCISNIIDNPTVI